MDSFTVSGFESLNQFALRFNIFREESGHTYSTEPSSYTRFAYIQEGYADFFVNECRIVRARPHDVVFIPPETAYHSIWPEQCCLFVIDVKMDDFVTSMQNYGDEIRILYTDTTGVLEESIEKFQENSADENSYMWMERVSIVAHILSTIVRTQQERMNTHSQISQSIVYLHYNYEKDTSVGKLAEMCSFSESQFRRLFKEYYGVSPIHYRNRLRMKHAERLMHDGNMTTAQVARNVGIDDVKYFTKLYKRYIGKSPNRKKTEE